MKYSNLHTHTTFSDGKHSVRENIESAIRLGMSSLGFSDHCYTYFDTSYCIPKDRVADYIKEVRDLGEEYRDRIEIYLGYELDGYAIMENRELYDYIIGDVHYVRTSDGLRAVDLSGQEYFDIVNNYFGGDHIALAKDYYEGYAERIAQMRPDVLGHIDLVAKYSYVDEQSPKYQRIALEALDAALDACPVLEMNTGAISRGYRKIPYPAPFFFDLIKSKGAKITLSSDSHNAENLTYFFDESVELLRANGIKSVVAFVGGKFEEFGI